MNKYRNQSIFIFISSFILLWVLFYGEAVQTYLNRGYDFGDANSEASGDTLGKCLGGSMLITFLYYIVASGKEDRDKYKAQQKALSKSKPKWAIQWGYKEYILSSPQKAIWSATVLVLGLVIIISLLDYSKSHTLSIILEHNIIPILCFIALELYIQLKIWAEHFRFKYPSSIAKTKEVSGETPPF